MKRDIVTMLMNKALPQKIEQEINVQGRFEHFFEYSQSELDREEENILASFGGRPEITAN
jgi:hypothetical protein